MQVLRVVVVLSGVLGALSDDCDNMCGEGTMCNDDGMCVKDCGMEMDPCCHLGGQDCDTKVRECVGDVDEWCKSDGWDLQCVKEAVYLSCGVTCDNVKDMGSNLCQCRSDHACTACDNTNMWCYIDSMTTCDDAVQEDGEDGGVWSEKACVVPLDNCTCKSSWTSEGEGCNVTQSGCPSTVCGGGSQPWCMIENSSCAQEEESGGWMYCTPEGSDEQNEAEPRARGRKGRS